MSILDSFLNDVSSLKNKFLGGMPLGEAIRTFIIETEKFSRLIDKSNISLSNSIIQQYNNLVATSISLRNKVAGNDKDMEFFRIEMSKKLREQGKIDRDLTQDEIIIIWRQIFITPLENICKKLYIKKIVKSGGCSGATQSLAGLDDLGFEPITTAIIGTAVITLAVAGVFITRYINAEDVAKIEAAKAFNKIIEEKAKIMNSNLPESEKKRRLDELNKTAGSITESVSAGSGKKISKIVAIPAVAIGGYFLYTKLRGR